MTSRRRLALAGVLAVLFLALYALSNRTVLGQALEDSWARSYDITGLPGLVMDDAHLPPFGFDRATVAVGLGAALLIAALQRRWRSVLTVAVAGPAALLIGELFKHVAGRPRLVPSLDWDVSYPSGHAGLALVVSAALLVALPARSLRWAVPLLGAWCLLVAGGLQAEGQHRASEVLGSGLLVAAVFAAVGAATLRRPSTVRLRELWARPGRAVVVAVLLIAAVVGAWTPVPWMSAVYAAAAAAATALALGVALTTCRESARPSAPVVEQRSEPLPVGAGRTP